MQIGHKVFGSFELGIMLQPGFVACCNLACIPRGILYLNGMLHSVLIVSDPTNLSLLPSGNTLA